MHDTRLTKRILEFTRRETRTLAPLLSARLKGNRREMGTGRILCFSRVTSRPLVAS